jgi:hypothetical protein
MSRRCAIAHAHARFAAGLAALAMIAVFALPAAAEPVPSPGGPVILPITGLSIDLPPATGGCTYRLSGSWIINDDDSFDGRDVIDEACGDSLVSGNWVSLGYFTAGDPAAVVAATTMTSDWLAEADLWGGHWAVHGGLFDLGELGIVPTAVLCTPMGGGMAALFYHFFLREDPATMTQAAMLAGLEQTGALRAAWAACSQRRFATAYPASRPEIRNRGETLASRTVTLANAGFDLDIPDDGFVWLARQNAESGSDFLDRMAPSLPDVSMEVAYLAGMDGETAFAAFDVEKRDVAPLNLPDDWDAGPQLVLGEGRLELTASYETLGGVVIVGIFQEAGDLDVAALAPMLEAIADAALISELGVLDK